MKILKISKNLENIFEHCFEHKLNRSSILIAFGGGVIGDMTGFAASIYQRGIDFIQIPTTLLAQVDASVGGKTGVNNSFGKNLIGSFYQPKAVYIDPKFLDTLPKREFSAGVAEIVKMAVTFDKDFFEELEKRYPQILDMATKRDLSETELRLIKEIEDTRKEIKELELKLTKEIEDTRKEIKELELKLTKEVEQVRLEVEEVRKEIKEVELKLTKEVEQVRLEVEEVRKEIKDVELKLTKEIEQVRFSTIKWIAGLIGGQTVVLITTFFTLLKLFLH